MIATVPLLEPAADLIDGLSSALGEYGWAQTGDLLPRTLITDLRTDLDRLSESGRLQAAASRH
jgi:hypothetical protein